MNEGTDRFAVARAVFRDSFFLKADPGGELPAEERAIRAELARRNYYRELGRKSGAARRQRREIRRQMERAGE